MSGLSLEQAAFCDTLIIEAYCAPRVCPIDMHLRASFHLCTVFGSSTDPQPARRARGVIISQRCNVLAHFRSMVA
jgi:hypothetical protein